MAHPGINPCARVRATASRIAAAAASVSIDDAALGAFASELSLRRGLEPPAWDASGWHYADDVQPGDGSGGARTAVYILVLDALNFCFWPEEGFEYDTLATGLTAALRADPSSFDAARLAAMTPDALQAWFAPKHLPAPEERARLVREVGAVLQAEWGGSALALLRAAQGSAVAAVRLVAACLPGFRDETLYAGQQAFFYKRAQIVVGDWWAAFGRRRCSAAEGEGAQAAHACPAAFCDIQELTCFADYRLPQLLRARGVLLYAPALGVRVDGRQELQAGSQEEVELRACTVEAVERLRGTIVQQQLRSGGAPLQLTAVELDWVLWQWGEEQKGQLPPHHRTATIFY